MGGHSPACEEPTLLEDVEAGVSLASVNYLLSMAIHPICLALNGAWLAWLSNGVVWNLDAQTAKRIQRHVEAVSPRA